jgi:hypothetical protein
VGRSGKPPNFHPISTDQRFFLGARPAFDAAFECQGIFASWSFGMPNQFNRSPAPGPFAAEALLVLP